MRSNLVQESFKIHEHTWQMCSIHGQLLHSPGSVQALHKISWAKLHKHHISWAVWAAPLLCHGLTEQRRAEQSICHGCGESSSQRSQASLLQLKHCRGFAPQHSPALRKMSFIQQVSPQSLPLSGKHLKISLSFMPGYQPMV